MRGRVAFLCGLACVGRFAFAGRGPLTCNLARVHSGLEARVTTNRDYNQLMAVFP